MSVSQETGLPVFFPLHICVLILSEKRLQSIKKMINETQLLSVGKGNVNTTGG